MIYKRCPRCGARIAEGTTCGRCGTKKEESKPSGPRALYRTYRWQKLQRSVMSAYGSVDQYAKAQGRLEAAEIIHHIVPTSERPDLFFHPENLIPVSRRSHDEIHERYKESLLEKEKLQQALRALVHPLV